MIRRIYTSARQPPPAKESATLRLEVNDALQLWRDIPTESLSSAVEMALIEAGNFLAANGLVAKAWRDRRGKETIADFAAIGKRDQEAEKRFLASPEAKQPTEEERAANAALAAEITRKLRMS